MIDMHVHLLPGVDDGPETLAASLALARVLVQEGVSSAVATPHYNDEFPHRPVTEIHERVNALQRVLDHHAIPLRLFAGHEVLITPGLVENIHMGRIATLNGSRYLLLELWSTAWLPSTAQVIFDLRVHGIVPIIAHPERHPAIQQDTNQLATLVRQGALTQLTASSLLGLWGKTVRRSAETLLKKGLIHCIASDAHDLSRRPPCMARGLQRAEELLGYARGQQMIETWPAAIINNKPCCS